MTNIAVVDSYAIETDEDNEAYWAMASYASDDERNKDATEQIDNGNGGFLFNRTTNKVIGVKFWYPQPGSSDKFNDTITYIRNLEGEIMFVFDPAFHPDPDDCLICLKAKGNRSYHSPFISENHIDDWIKRTYPDGNVYIQAGLGSIDSQSERWLTVRQELSNHDSPLYQGKLIPISSMKECIEKAEYCLR